MSDHEDMLRKYFVQTQEQPSLLSRDEAREILLKAGSGSPTNRTRTGTRSIYATAAISAAVIAVFLMFSSSKEEAAIAVDEGSIATLAQTAPPAHSTERNVGEEEITGTQNTGSPNLLLSHRDEVQAGTTRVSTRPVTHAASSQGIMLPATTIRGLVDQVEQSSMFRFAANFAEMPLPQETSQLDYIVAGTSLTPLAESHLLPQKVVISKLQTLSVSQYDDYNPMISPDGRTLYFISTREHGFGGHDFWIATKEHRDDPEFSQPRNLGSGINTPGDEGAGSISGDGQVMYFTGCDRPDGLGDCDIYEAQLGEEGWVQVRNVREINSKYWDVQPTVSADGRAIYFISNRPGAMGSHDDADIYVSHKKADGTWSIPENLGSPINTSKREDSPFIAPGGNALYFSSAGHKGMGKLDFFVSYKEPDGRWGTPENLGPAFNSPNDERFITLPAAEDIVYFASSDGKKGLDLFMGRRDARSSSVVINGKVLQQETGERLNARLLFVDGITGEVLAGTSTNEETGEFSFVIGQHTKHRTIDVYGITENAQEFRAHISVPSAASYLVYQCDLTLQKTQKELTGLTAGWSPGLTIRTGADQDHVLVDIPDTPETELLILDAWGHKLFEKTISAGTAQETIDFTGMPQGLYLARLGEKTGIIEVNRKGKESRKGS